MNVRYLSVISLGKILGKSKKPRDILERVPADIDKRDRSLLTEIVYGVIRYRDYLDWIIRHFLKNPSNLSQHTINNLRTSIYQIKYMRIPEWAVVNEAVNTEKLLKGKPGLVNAVLRNFLRHKDNIVPSEDNKLEYISITTSHPKWLIKRWLNRFGYQETISLAEKNNEIPPFVIRLTRESERNFAFAKLKEKGLNLHKTNYSPDGLIVDNIKTFHELSELLKGFRYFVQDEASQLITYILNPKEGEWILDACAAPGGKTTHIAELTNDNINIIALEYEKKRIKKIYENIKRLGLKSIQVIHGDVLELDKILSSQFGKPILFDKILLDAPCSSLGVIRKNPDIKYKHTEAALLHFKNKQLKMINAVSKFLRKGGILVYSVCSTEKEEGEDVIKEFLQKNHNFCIIKGDFDFLSPFEVIDEEGNLFYRTFPHRHNMDGFFGVRLKRL